MGFNVLIHPYENFYNDANEVDIVIVLRGLKRYTVNPNHINIMWNISHPDDITIEEYEDYDIVFIASLGFAKKINSQTNAIVRPLLQCTDSTSFFPEKNEYYSNDILFVGNTRGVFRSAIKNITQTNHNFSVYGGGNWHQFIDKEHIKGEFIPNSDLNQAYSSCKILLNDHWDDMRIKDFPSNRLFDAFASEAFIISDDFPSADSIFEGNLITYENVDDLNSKINYYLTHEKERKLKSKKGREIVLKNHTFNKRAKTIVNYIKQLDDLLEKEKGNEIKISIIIPVFNAEKYLGECLDSVLSQSIKDIEVLCIDHGSTDNSYGVMEKYASLDARVKIFSISNEKRGAGAPRNVGLENAKGKYIHFLDPDDWVTKDGYEKLYIAAEENNLDLLLFKILPYINADGRTFKNPAFEFISINNLEGKIFNIDDLGKNILDLSGSSVNKLIRHDFIKKINARFPEGIFSQDHAFAFQLYLNAKRISFINDYFYYYRQHPSSVTAKTGKKQFDYIKARNIVFNVFKKFNYFDKFKSELINQKLDILNKLYWRMSEPYIEDFFNLLKEDFINMRDVEKIDENLLKSINPYNKEFYEKVISSKNNKEFCVQTCPICGNIVEKFLVLNDKEVRCPHCKSVPRQRLFYLFFKNFTTIFEKNNKLLYFDPEYPIYSAFKKDNRIKLFSVSSKNNTSDLVDNQINIEQMPFEDDEFDLIYIDSTIKNELNTLNSSNELFRVIKSYSEGGLLVLRGPAFNNLDESSLISAGFKIKKYSANDILSPYNLNQYNIDSNLKIFLCMK